MPWYTQPKDYMLPAKHYRQEDVPKHWLTWDPPISSPGPRSQGTKATKSSQAATAGTAGPGGLPQPPGTSNLPPSGSGGLTQPPGATEEVAEAGIFSGGKSFFNKISEAFDPTANFLLEILALPPDTDFTTQGAWIPGTLVVIGATHHQAAEGDPRNPAFRS